MKFRFRTRAALRRGPLRTRAHGVLSAPGSYTNGICKPVPKDSPFTNSKLFSVPLTNGDTACDIECNITEVQETGVDPCHVASVTDPTDSPMSCFNLGASMAGGWGLCGYNCSIFHAGDTTKLVPCTQADVKNRSLGCSIYCDSRKFPTAKNGGKELGALVFQSRTLFFWIQVTRPALVTVFLVAGTDPDLLSGDSQQSLFALLTVPWYCIDSQLLIIWPK